jgi:hypothetical protein
MYDTLLTIFNLPWEDSRVEIRRDSKFISSIDTVMYHAADQIIWDFTSVLTEITFIVRFIGIT